MSRVTKSRLNRGHDLTDKAGELNQGSTVRTSIFKLVKREVCRSNPDRRIKHHRNLYLHLIQFRPVVPARITLDRPPINKSDRRKC